MKINKSYSRVLKHRLKKKFNFELFKKLCGSKYISKEDAINIVNKYKKYLDKENEDIKSIIEKLD